LAPRPAETHCQARAGTLLSWASARWVAPPARSQPGGLPARPAVRGRRRRPHRRSPRRPGPRRPRPGRASWWPEPAWSQTRPGRGRRRPGNARGRRSSPGERTGPSRSGRAGIGGVDHVDRDLGVLDPACGPGVLALHPNRPGAFLRSPVSSTTSTACGSPMCSTTSARRSSRTPSWSQTRPGPAGAPIPSGVASPACSAIVQQFLRGRSASSPSTNALACRRGSTRGNRAATRPSNSSGPARHRPGSTSN
jgi:hypothetical protein